MAELIWMGGPVLFQKVGKRTEPRRKKGVQVQVQVRFSDEIARQRQIVTTKNRTSPPFTSPCPPIASPTILLVPINIS
jgi:hypothetical protein